MESIETKRFMLRQMEEKEYAAFYRLLDSQSDSIPSFVQKNVIEFMMRKNKYFSIFEKNTDEYIGYICLQVVETEICNELGIAIKEEYQKHGIASEIIPVFLNWINHQYDIQTVVIRVEPDNIHSQHLFEKLGAIFDGMQERKDPSFLKLNEMRKKMGIPEEPLPKVLYYHFDLPVSV